MNAGKRKALEGAERLPLSQKAKGKREGTTGGRNQIWKPGKQEPKSERRDPESDLLLIFNFSFPIVHFFAPPHGCLIPAQASNASPTGVPVTEKGTAATTPRNNAFKAATRRESPWNRR